MANPLTGDFEAVLQVSGSTVNRLLASMHQNGGTKPNLPNFPHGIWIRVGDPTPIDGMRGNILAQVSVPRIDLIHAVSDRFWLEVSVRARYTADPGTVPIPEFIHGTVRAQYRIDNIDPSCKGWEKLAPEYLWIRPIRDTISFTGTAEDDASFLSVTSGSVDPATADARITALARFLLTKRFEATPHRVSRRFRRGSMRSLTVGANRSVVAVPIALSGDPTTGNINSINQDILDGRDVGIAINRDVIIRKIQQELDAVKASFRPKFEVRSRTYVDLGFLGDLDVLELNLDYTVVLTSATAQWLGGIVPILGITVPAGIISISISGDALTPDKRFNFKFDVTQMLAITFDESTESFAAAPIGSATVNIPGIIGVVIESKARPVIQDEIKTALTNAASGLTGQLSLQTRKKDLIDQLKTMDDAADAWFDKAVFTNDGVMVRGQIALSGRKLPVNSFAISADKNGYSAFDSWIPGGRVDSFSWSWKWFNNSGNNGSENATDRFVLRRPMATGRGRFGLMSGLRHPLPGLDGMGQMCLVVSGVRVHSISGDLVPSSTKRKCKRFGLDLRLATPGRVFLREWVPGPRDPIGPVAEVAVHEVGGPYARGHDANTLLIRIGDRWNREVAMSVREGLANSRRLDAGLVVLVLFGDGRFMQSGGEWLGELNELAAEIEAPLIVNEDVGGSWSTALRMQKQDGTVGDLEWRLISPTGGVTWAHSGSLDAEELAHTLDVYLFTSPVPAPAQSTYDLPLGTKLSSLVFESDVIGRLNDMEEACPPSPFGRLGIDTQVTFVSKNSKSSEAAMRKLGESRGESDDTSRAVVFDGATAEELEHLRQSLPEGVVAIPDPDGVIAKRLGIRSWPSTIAVDGNGLVTTVETGAQSAVEADPGEPLTSEAS
ncbi:MAG TPA: hypothetical protein VM939_02075 [Gemmatimonadaceae bacterium]|nr:hypothetical protein [Gemmatimonadaceae bacterium]